MKYMHFKASCSYAALANLLELQGVDTEDRAIAQEMGLPWLFSRDGDAFVSGPMLQSAEWFNLWLLPRGLCMTETSVKRDALCPLLQKSEPAMLGIRTPYGKHAVVFIRYDGVFRFLNPTHENSGEEMEIVLTEGELMERTDETVMLAHVGHAEPRPVNLSPYFRRSVQIVHENVEAITRFAAEPHDPDDYLPALNALFRPLLLDGISMLTLTGEWKLANRFTELQGALMSFMRGSRTGQLKDALSLPKLSAAAEAYIRLIECRITR